MKSLLSLLQEVGAVHTEGHFVYTSGKHGANYLNKDALYPHTRHTRTLCEEMARRFQGDSVEVVVAPVIGGVILSQWVAYCLSEGTTHEVLSTYAEKSDDGGFVLRRGYDALVRGKRVLVVEDVLNTGGSVARVVEAVRAVGGQVVGVAALCNRGGVTALELGDIPKLEALVTLEWEAWNKDQCPLCKKGIPVHTDLGKGRTR